MPSSRASAGSGQGKSEIPLVLSRTLIGKTTQRELLAYLRERLPRLERPAEKGAWLGRAAHIRGELLESFFRGHPPGLLDEKPDVQWLEALDPGGGYRIHKLRYEGYPGMWIPALLYEPTELRGRAPAVLNPNGHHAGGKAMSYKQARCINLAKRGILALNTEFVGMGELRADVEHNRIALLDLCGVAGIGVFYLIMKRGLDVLLDHPQADPERVAMTGLSGGGWQTIVLSALDERITVSVPVAGHSPVWQRIRYMSDIGDQEQIPSDLCTVADYDTLTAMLAPRPSLLIYNRYDDCCFQAPRTRRSVYQPAKPVFAMLGAPDRLGFHDNIHPGTHNYDRDNRTQLYRFLGRHFGLDTPEDDLPWQSECYTEAELNVGLPQDNATLHSLAQEALGRIRESRTTRRAEEDRKRLVDLLNVPEFGDVSVGKERTSHQLKGYTVYSRVLNLDDTWSLPLVEFAPPRSRGLDLIMGDDGRRGASAMVDQALRAGRRAVAADLFGSGEAAVSWQYHMILAATGERSLGLQVGQLLALIRWICGTYRTDAVHLTAAGQIMPVVALAAAALDPDRLTSLTTATLMDSLGRLIDWPLPYASAAPLFCFGLLKEFDIEDLIALSAPVPLHDSSRGPLRGRRA